MRLLNQRILRVGLVLLGSCHTAAQQEQREHALDYTHVAPLLVQGTVLGPSDVFEVQVFQEKDLGGVYRVAADGTIKFPLCGSVAVSGKTGSEIEDMLIACLRTGGYLKAPQVSLFVKEFNSKKVFVFGEVQKPGTFAYESGMTVVQAVTLAGGFTAKAEANSTSVSRQVEKQEHKIKIPVKDIGNGRAPNFALAPGDIVYVPESFF